MRHLWVKLVLHGLRCQTETAPKREDDLLLRIIPLLRRHRPHRKQNERWPTEHSTYAEAVAPSSVEFRFVVLSTNKDT